MKGSSVESVIEGYGLNIKAKKAIECMHDIEQLCRDLRAAFPGHMDGCEDAEKRFVEGYNLIWDKVMLAYKSNGGPKLKRSVTKKGKAIKISPWSDPFNW